MTEITPGETMLLEAIAKLVPLGTPREGTLMSASTGMFPIAKPVTGFISADNQVAIEFSIYDATIYPGGLKSPKINPPTGT